MKLFEPGKIGKLNLKNRIVMAAMGCGGLIQPDGKLSPKGIDYYAARAKGGTGFIITSSCRASRELEPLKIHPLVPYLVLDSKINSGWLDELADAVHDYGAKVALQLSAGEGRVRSRKELNEIGHKPPIAPSAQPCFADPNVMANELTLKEIEHLIQAFGYAAQIAKAAGMDAIELNCHGGYLFDQFMTGLWNQRADQYGGGLEGRLRLLFEVIKKIKEGCGEDFPLIVKFGLTHYLEGGREIDEGLEIARRLENAGVDALCVDAGSYETRYWLIPSEFQPRGCTVELAEMTKKVVKIPVMAVSKLGYPELAERVLKEGKADFIALARPLLADPDWANKVKEGRPEDIRPCIGCLEGCHHRIQESKAIGCAVNPMTGKEKELELRPAEKKKKVFVIGGGPGGMEAARVAALRGHKVTLWEKRDNLSGNLASASAPDFKRDYRILIHYFSTQMKKLGVTIKLKKEVSAELIEKMKPDVVFVATGSTPILLKIPGAEKKNVITAIDLLLGRRRAGKSVVVIGGGIVGCETALYIAQKGRCVTIVEILDGIARDMYVINRMHLLKLLSDAKVKILTETRVLEITSGNVMIEGRDGQKDELEADTVVLAVGLRPNDELISKLRGKVKELYSIGDCNEPRKVIDAIWEGFRLARLI
ncbi:MAG: FAD-dependent oxidoreductase [Thermodesulfobacteriota bacterium]|nr:FAD-dependent oxidoreductase [Thermodesulfobacteriota bacterium]